MNTNTLRQNEQRAKNAILLIWLVCLAEILCFISGYFQYDLLQTVSHGGEISDETATANDLREMVTGIVYLVVYIVSAITFILWFRRAYFNLQQKAPFHLSNGEGWAAGAWFVPIANLYVPYQIMKELYRETKDLLIKNAVSPEPGLQTRLLGWWWTLWIINGVAGQIVFRISLNAETLDELTASTVAGMVSNILGIPLAFLAVRVIRDYARVEPLMSSIPDTEITPALSPVPA